MMAEWPDVGQVIEVLVPSGEMSCKVAQQR